MLFFISISEHAVPNGRELRIRTKLFIAPRQWPVFKLLLQ